MIEEEGIVVETEGSKAKVAVLRKSACDSCSASGVCHPDSSSYMEADNPVGAVKGQKVRVMVSPQVYLKASLVVYGLPVIALIGGAILGKNIAMQQSAEADSDLWAFLAGMLSMAVSFLFVRMYNRKVERSGEHRPEIVEILA